MYDLSPAASGFTDLPADALVACAAEPIHLPAAVQPHGLLLAIGAGAHVIAGAHQCFGEMGTDESVGAGDENLLHGVSACRACREVASGST